MHFKWSLPVSMHLLCQLQRVIEAALPDAVRMHGHGHENMWLFLSGESWQVVEQASGQQVAKGKLLMVFKLMQ